MASSRSEDADRSTKTAPSPSQGARRTSSSGTRFDQSQLIALAAIAIFLVSTVIAYNQSPRANPLEVVSPLSSNWWWHPREVNAFKRLPTITANLNDVFALSGTGLVWAVGERGTILHSDNHGHTWTKQQIGVPTPPAPTPPVTSRSLIPNLLGTAHAASAPSPENTKPEATPGIFGLRIVPDSPTGEGQQSSKPIPQSAISNQMDLTPLPPTNPSLSIEIAGEPQIGASTAKTNPLTESLATTRIPQQSNQTSPKQSTASRKKPTSTPTATPASPRQESTTQSPGPRAASPSQKIESHSRAIENLQAVIFVDGKQGWVAGDNGTLLHTTDGGTTWVPQTSGTPADLTSLHFLPDGKQGWVAGDNGTLLHTTDGGATWAPQTSGTLVSLTSLLFLPDGKQGWVAGRNGTLLHTTDGGATWNSPVHYGVSLAPWYFVAGWLCPLGLLWVAHQAKQNAKPTVQEASVADRLVSDRPLQLGDPDPLKFHRIATALSRFIRNNKTDPPLTIAISGAWGTGKSSLMNLVKGDLEQYKFRPVWFNVWHHQKEEQLLASLLESIRRQAVPPWWKPAHLGFRGRLLKLRFKDHWPLGVLTILLTGICIGYFGIDPQKRWGAVVELASNLVKLKFSDDFSQVLVILGLGTALTPLFALWKGLTTFGLNPAGLLASLSKGASVGDLSVQAGFRERFATEFHDVTQALHPRTMLILIDDLDRCRPDKVLEVLEAINFLVSSGECFVVMGLDLERVERCVGLGFKDVADELLDDSSSPDSSPRDKGKQRRSEFAHQYMEKLINIEVPVPSMNATDSIQVVTSSGPRENAIPHWSDYVVSLRAFAKGFVLPIAAVTILCSGIWLGMSWIPGTSQTSTESTPTTTLQPNVSVQQNPAKGPLIQPVEIIRDLAGERGITFSPGETSQPLPWTWVLIGILVIGAGAHIAKTKPGVVVKDSPEFEEALRVWLPLISGKRQTPRAIKRFVNKVRYLAMLQRQQTSNKNLWDRISRLLRVRPSQSTAETLSNEDVQIPEASLVALSAIQQFYPLWIQHDQFYKLASDNDEDYTEDSIAARNAIRGRVTEHERQFGDWRATHSYHAQFLSITSGIRTR